MARKQINSTNQSDPISCAVCGRRLLRGESPNAFLHAGKRVSVCDLCTAHAVRDGWIREGFDDLQAGSRPSRARGSLLGRLRSKPTESVSDVIGDGEWRTPETVPGQEPVAPDVDADDFLDVAPAQAQSEQPSWPAEEPDPGGLLDRFAARAPATNASLKVDRAIQVFNDSDQIQTIAGVARSLGAPTVSVRLSESESSLVTIVASWEISWYRFEVDLSDESAGARLADRGYDLADLHPAAQASNAIADDWGQLHIASTAP